nr:MAG TPA: hypothetical protein [Caudoviricetes sp.]
MTYTPRTCPGKKKNAKLSMSVCSKSSLKSTSRAIAINTSTNWRKRARMNDILKLSLCLTNF